jgi:hypothetical protein
MSEVICCLTCLTDREVEGTNASQTGACPGCGNLGWSRPRDLARDDAFFSIHDRLLPEPRLRGNGLRRVFEGPFPGPPSS